MSNRWVISWLVIDYWRWSMSNRSPKILWPIDYSSMTSITHWCNWLLIDDPSITHRLLNCARKTLFLPSGAIFFSFVIILSVLDAFFLVLSEDPVDERRKVLITNIDDFQLYNISLYPTLYLITKPLNSNQPVWKMKLTFTLTRIDYVVIDFFLWVFVSKVRLLWLRETSVISSYITSLSIEYLHKFRFFGLWAKHDSFIF